MKERFVPRFLPRSHAFVLTTVVVIVGRSGLALATDCTTNPCPCTYICPATGDCVIGSQKNVDPGAKIDCSGRDITIGNSGSLKVTGGDLILLADDLTLNGPGGLIYAVEGTAEEAGTVEIHLTGSLLLAGKVRANGAHGGGSIYIDAAGNISIPENGTDGIEADGTEPDASGGDIVVRAGGSMAIHDPIHAEGNTSGESGGGSVELRAGGDIDVSEDGHLSAPGKTEGGGVIILKSEDGNVTFAEHIDVDGKGPTGDGGTIEIAAGGSIAINGQLYARGGINAGGGTAAGGEVVLEAGCGGVTINASILTVGGQLGTGEDGGSIEVESAGDILVASGVLLDTHALASGGDGGPVRLAAADLVSLVSGSTIDSRGNSTSPGRGGDVSIRGCRIDIQSAVTLDTTGAEGGTVKASATAVPPAVGTQPLFVSQSASLRAKGASTAVDGRISISPLTAKKGKCSNNEAIACVIDQDCTDGCLTGDCLHANPDTQGVTSQFDLAPGTLADLSLGECEATCD